jgi:hypothetical protein
VVRLLDGTPRPDLELRTLRMNRADAFSDPFEPARHAPDAIVNPGGSIQGNDNIVNVPYDFLREALEE